MSEFSKAVKGVDFDAQTKKLLALVSPSQVETWDQCNRKWVFAYIFGLKTPSSPEQQSGTELHAECEHTSETGEIRNTKWKAVVQVALKKGLILRGPLIKNETWIEIPTLDGGPKMRGKYDAVDFEKKFRDAVIEARLVNDYKSAKNFRWAKTPKELSENIQLTTYGMAVLNDHPEDTHIALRHTYLRTEGAADAMKVDVVVPRARIVARWKKTIGYIENMNQLVRELPREEGAITSVEPTLTHCSAYKGCPYRPMCGLGNETFSFTGLTNDGEIRGLEAPRVPPITDFSFEKDLTPAKDRDWDDEGPEAEALHDALKKFSFDKEEKTIMGLLEDMMNGVEPKAVKAPSTVKAPPPEAPKEAAPAPASDVCAKCKGKRWIPNPDPAAPVGSHMMCKECGKTSITPPDQPARDAGRLPPAVEASEEAPKEKKRGRPKKEATAPVGKILIEQEDGTMKEYTDNAKEEAATAREGKADDLEQEARRILENPAPLSDGGPSDDACDLAEKVIESKTKKKPSKEGVAIYIDCLPTKGSHSGEGIDYLEWLAPVAERVAASKKKADWRMIEYSAEGELAAEIHATIKKSGLPPVVLVSGSSRARAPFLEVAGMFASTVIMAVGR